MSAPFLSVHDLHVSYDGIRAVRGVSILVGEGEVVALLGPNGAGKSSTLRAIMGLAPRSSGEVRFRGTPLPSATEDIVRLGVTLSPEGRRIFADLTVAENLMLGGSTRSEAERRAGIDHVLGLFPILGERFRANAGVLSGGEQQQLAIARALMCRPKLLLLDEPSLGLAPRLTEQILDMVARLRDEGISILMVEQNVQASLTRSDRVYVLVSGQIVLERDAADIMDASEISRAYFGAAVA
ncbi:MAG: ABC transporter ATP-binding protein [Pseudomonadota bacterium]